ncbi:MAG TPA: multidrug efflux RND transporter permease subunit [Terriglobales bacterium]|nr:multidrug efflux RND transporter permease subunit [Terriglobales bacterium]
MHISAPFIRRPIGTSLLAIALLMAGILAFYLLPVAPLPQVEYPVIVVGAGLPGASPETMASAVATPLERQFGRIAGVNQMTSSSQQGSTSVVLQFDLSRNIDAAARDVQAAINAARGNLPANLPSNPWYRKVNPADAPVLILAMTSDIISRPEMYDQGETILAQKLSQVEGIGQVGVWGGARPAVRVEVNPTLLNKLGIGLDKVRSALGLANANGPKGELSGPINTWSLSDNDQLFTADQYKKLLIASNPKTGGTVRLGDVADVKDSVEDVRNSGLANGRPAVLAVLFRQPGANIIGTVDRVYAILPQLRSSISPSIHLDVVMDRTTTIRASVNDIELTLLISIVLVVLVVFVFLRNLWTTFIPSVAVPLSLVGTFGVMYLLGYSLDNLSLMALAISTGFVVDDAIVVIENITRYLEKGMRPVEAALIGSREIGFTVLSMSTSLVAVFIPILLMGGIVGRLFREFAVTLSVAIGVSLIVSLTTTPMLCAKFLQPHGEEKHGKLYRWSESGFDWIHKTYDHGLRWVLRHQSLTLLITIGTACLSVYLYIVVPKGFFPQQDTGRIGGSIQAAQDISFDAMNHKMEQFVKIVGEDPAVDTVVSFAGGSSVNSGRSFITLKPRSERKETSDQVIARLRRKLSVVPGATLYMQSAQDLNIGGRMGNAQFQYTLQGENLEDLNAWAPRVLQKLRTVPQLRDVNTDQQTHGLQASVVVDRTTASRLGVTSQAVDAALYDAFGQRQVSTMYRQLNQYHVVMEVDPRFSKSVNSLENIYVRASNGTNVPLSAFAHFEQTYTSLAANHQGQFPSITLSFNLAPGVALGDATRLVQKAMNDIGVPSTIHASFQGTAAAFQQSLSTEWILILTAIGAVYIVLGMLYESYIHPFTILSTLPSAGVGAILALLITRTDLTIIAVIGIILLIGIVKKNAIMMIDFAVFTERNHGKSAEDAIYEACLLRFRPIMMTTAAALLGGLPLAIGGGVGAELRRPLGITIVGGLIVSQMLTLFTTPVVYLYMDRFQTRIQRLVASLRGQRPEEMPPTNPSPIK